MKECRFSEVVDIAKVGSCASCSTFIYTMPCAIDIDFGDFIKPIGALAYPLAKIKSVQMENKDVILKSRVGRTWFEIKFKRDVKELFDIQISSYVEYKSNIKILI